MRFNPYAKDYKWWVDIIMKAYNIACLSGVGGVATVPPLVSKLGKRDRRYCTVYIYMLRKAQPANYFRAVLFHKPEHKAVRNVYVMLLPTHT